MGIASIVAIVVAAAPAAPEVDLSSARLTFVRGGSIFVVEDGRSPQVYLRTKTEKGWRKSYFFPAWSPDGRWLAAGEQNSPPPRSESHEWSALVLFDRRGKSPLRGRRSLADTPGRSSWSPDGRRLVYCSIYGFGDPPDEYGCTLHIIDIASGRRRFLTPAMHSDGDPAWSPDGKLIAFEREYEECDIDPNLEVVCPPDGLHVVAPTGGRARRLTRMQAKNPTWSPDGKYVAFDDGRRIGIVSSSGSRVRFIATGTDPAWSPDGDVIALEKKNDVWLVQPNGKRPRLAFRNASDPAWRRSSR